ncbi:hypothetical protein, partial [Streptomyces sp. SPB78]|uniref:hypothetical protein n=1 Tax=Streptomyces sp. (strain SPB78) TaxID=591157 RepID=UPI001F249D25
KKKKSPTKLPPHKKRYHPGNNQIEPPRTARRRQKKSPRPNPRGPGAFSVMAVSGFSGVAGPSTLAGEKKTRRERP